MVTVHPNFIGGYLRYHFKVKNSEGSREINAWLGLEKKQYHFPAFYQLTKSLFLWLEIRLPKLDFLKIMKNETHKV